MTHLDLFSGIGGFSLAVDTIFHEQKNQHIFVEWDPFCQAVLKKHWPEAEYHSDIRAFVADSRSEKPHRLSSKQGEEVAKTRDCYILTGGFPCQPFSHAGRRKGTDDDRYLWPPMLEAITIFRPEWVIAENVAGLASWNEGLVLETVCADLEREGYEVQPFIIPAVAVGAPHRRDRVWIVAHSDGRRRDAQSRIGSVGTPKEDNDNAIAPNFDAPDTKYTRFQRSRKERKGYRGQCYRNGCSVS